MRNEGNDGVAVPGKMIAEQQMKEPLAAAARLRRGKVLIGVGTVISMLGIAVYCAAFFVGDVNNEPVRFSGEGLVIIGTGLAVWIAGAVRYLNAAIDMGYSDDSL